MIIKIQTLPTSGNFNQIYKSLLSLWESIVLIISIESTMGIPTVTKISIVAMSHVHVIISWNVDYDVKPPQNVPYIA